TTSYSRALRSPTVAQPANANAQKRTIQIRRKGNVTIARNKKTPPPNASLTRQTGDPVQNLFHPQPSAATTTLPAPRQTRRFLPTPASATRRVPQSRETFLAPSKNNSLPSLMFILLLSIKILLALSAGFVLLTLL